MLTHMINEALDQLEFVFDDDNGGRIAGDNYLLTGGIYNDKYRITFSSDEGNCNVYGETIEEMDRNFKAACNAKLRDIHEHHEPHILDEMDGSGLGAR